MEQEDIKGVLDDLKEKQFKDLKFYLKVFSQQEAEHGGKPGISESTLEKINTSSELAEVLVERYPGNAVEKLKKLLEKVPRNDLVERLNRRRSRERSPAAKLPRRSRREMGGAEGASVRNLDCYDMKGRRVAFMMCVTEGRPGAENDIETMRKWFDEFRFETLVGECINPSRGELKEELKLFTRKIKQSNEEISCCLITLMSHGTANGYILDKDNKEICLEEIFSLFNNKECPELRGKPKIFIIQACRGGGRDYGVVQADDRSVEPDEWSSMKLPTASDYFIVYSSQKGFISLRSRYTGSVMIAAMDEVFSEHGRQWHIGDLFTEVNSKMAQSDFYLEGEEESVKVTAVMESTLTKAVYLSPN